MCRAIASTSAGSQSKSGNPCDRLIASRSAASFDITVKIVVPTDGSFEVMVMGLSRGACSMAVVSDTEALEDAGVAILAALVPAEVPAVHRHIDAGGQHLHERQGAAQVEQ